MYWLLGIGAAVVAGAWAWGASMVGKPRPEENEGPQANQPPSTVPPPVVVPPIPTLPPVAPGTIPQLPAIPPQIDVLTQQFLANFVQTEGAPIVAGDLINVDLRNAEIGIPQNMPVVGKAYMVVESLSAPNDLPAPGAQYLMARFASPELAILGVQRVRRSACEKVSV